ncbi:two-component system chemotaxis sensor kinase CheA [Rhodopirellula rubra]|uniref:histidine kinase n=1 Tax=Aporhodopirellula rubra TaxID=980271 RepID=A0A7W5DUM6_9BACT|nr:chemotaxis protein CheW [Aporhodopirellula rubra]MBB3204851.1 two-component system chemotaxis sensor kinase CheA [Aporhodopirellula rubra]
MNIEDAELIKDFVIESQEHLGDIEKDFLTMELQGAEIDLDLVNHVFRAIHSIKGAAGFLGLPVLESLAHREEEVLNKIRNREVIPTVEVVSTLLSATDGLKELLDCIEVSNDMDVSEKIAALDRILSGSSESNDTEAANPSDDSQRDNEQLVKESEATLDQATAAVETLVNEDSTPSPSDATASNDDTAPSPVATPAPKPTPKPTKQVEAAKSPSSLSSDSSPAETSIRVDVGLLDTLMNQVGELVLARNQMLQFAERFDDNEYNTTSQRLNLITSELQEGVMKTRMQPIGNVWSKFPRLVRDLAQICEKEVRIEMQGKETELDKTIIEAIKDPLTHLVRNTVDHGIESPDVREAYGKDREGCLMLRAFHEGGQVNIEICDDGAGLNVDRIRTKAIEKSVITEQQAQSMDEQEICNLIFAPGFSTAEKVSNVSGRGVGMDVVKTNIEKIGGTLDLESHSGLGTTVRIKIPLTLAIIPALLVKCAENRFAIPQVNLMELVRLEGEQATSKIDWIQNAPVYRLRGQLLPLVDLRNILGKAPKERADNVESEVINIVVLRADDQQFGLIVESINDTEEIVVKPLSAQIKELPVYSGATILGDGSVALILDVLGVAQRGRVLQSSGSRNPGSQDDSSNAEAERLQSLLVLGIGQKRQVAMHMSQVARLEQVPDHMIEEANGQSVIQYRGKILPLIDMASVLGVPRSRTVTPGDDGEASTELASELTNQVVVYSEDGRSFGLVVDRIIDIVEADIDLVESTSGNGLLGSAIIQDRVIDLLDLPTVIQSAGHRLA